MKKCGCTLGSKGRSHPECESINGNPNGRRWWFGNRGAGQVQRFLLRGRIIVVRWISTGYCFRLLTKNFVRLALIGLAFLILMLLYSCSYSRTVTSDRRGMHNKNYNSRLLKNTQTELSHKHDEPSVIKRKIEPHPISDSCLFPQLDPFAPQMMGLINMTIFRSNYSCAADPALGTFKEVAFHVEKGNNLIRDVEIPRDVTCCFQDVSRGNDDETVKVDEKCKKLENNATPINWPIEIVMVTCKKETSFLKRLAVLFYLANEEIYYRDAFQIFHEKPEVERRIKNWHEESKMKEGDDGRLSVLVIGMETTSQMQFERAMPKSKLFLEEKLKAVRFMGYHSVGHNTYPNIVPLLTGMTQEEFEKECVEKTKVSSWFGLDFLGGGGFQFHKCHFIWKTFAAHGYRTSFTEDDFTYSLSNYPHRNAFSAEPPTDYYYRPFSVLMEKVLKFGDECYGPRLSFESLLENAKSIADMFQQKDRQYFNFLFSTTLTHHSMNEHQFAEKPLLELLHYLHGNGHLNHTALFLLGDHGYPLKHEIEQAKIESRMPLAYIVLPQWFPQKYPKALENLRWNAANSVTSHFDMHKTILDMMDLNRLKGDDGNWRENRYFQPILPEMGKRGQSLFEINSSGRDCGSAGIPHMYCPCVERIPLKNDSFLAVKGSQAVFDRANEKTSKYWFTGCEKLQLGRVLEATFVMMDKAVMEKAECRFLINNATIEEVAEATMPPCNNSIKVELKVMGAPHDPIYQAVVYHTPTGDFSAPDIVRKDWYSEKGHCVHHELQPYCICKS